MDTEKLLSNFENYSKVLKKYFPDSGIETFLEDFGVRITTCPRGLTEADGGQPGALIDFMLKVALVAREHADVLAGRFGENAVCKRTVARVCLVHEIGKLGSDEHELFVTQESQWHRDKLGQRFKYNEECTKMAAGHRALYLLQKYNINLTEEEWIAILTCQGMHYPENAFYGNSLNTTAKVLHFARSIVSD
tara:strand:+ start:787 stop:1362 length:576 start_codon:yes stop_codon:yes gene_type:complete